MAGMDALQNPALATALTYFYFRSRREVGVLALKNSAGPLRPATMTGWACGGKDFVKELEAKLDDDRLELF